MPTITETNRFLDRQERRFEREAFRALMTQFKRALDEFEDTGQIKPELIHPTHIEVLFEKIYLTVGVKAAKIQYNEIISRQKKGLEETFEEIMRGFMRGNTGPIIGNITLFSQSQFQKIVAARVAEGLENNWSRQRISRNLRKDVRELNKHRARTIARTEVGKAQSVGHLKGIEATGLQYTKSWHTNVDGRERDDHREAQRNEANQNIPKEQPFIVGGEQMQAPRVGGSAKQVVNCRCQALYEVVEEEELVDVAHT